VSARLGKAAPARAILRNVAGGALAMAVTYFVGTLIGNVD
jgi:VIT1/CCC1 family predicted Fe2+/Mn2+ transporter